MIILIYVDTEMCVFSILNIINITLSSIFFYKYFTYLYIYIYIIIFLQPELYIYIYFLLEEI